MASAAKYKTALRTQIRRRHAEHEVNFLNITAMMDMMTIILVFLLKSLSASQANLPSTSDLSLPSSLLNDTADLAGIQIVVSRDKVLVNGTELQGVQVPNCFNSAAEVPTKDYQLRFCGGDSLYGFDTKFKGRNDRKDLEIKPLFNALTDPVRVAAAQAAKLAPNHGKDIVDATILFDRYTSYRVMTEIMFTLGQAKVSRFHFLVIQGAK